MLVIPAVDIKGGRCVRLFQGQMDKETFYSDDPAAMARKWAAKGAKRIHVVDLDGAVSKRPVNLEPVKEIVKSAGVKIQVGGGIRDMETIRMYLDLGVDRVIIGTEAARNPEFVEEACARFPGSIVVGIDAKNGLVSIEGWTRTMDLKAVDLAKRFEESGVAAIHFTDIERDGTKVGPNITATRELARAVSIPVIASGGVSSLDDIVALRKLEQDGVTGVIVGRALYDGRFDLTDAIRVAESGREVS